MIEEFQFVEEGRTYTCRVEQPRGGRVGAWWWFGVSGDAHRYAPFQAVDEDTEAEVRTRVIAYYNDLLVRRAQPAQPRSHWARRTPTTAAAPVDGAVEASVEAPGAP
jgi:hypothetical protein